AATGIRDYYASRGLGDVYKRPVVIHRKLYRQSRDLYRRFDVVNPNVRLYVSVRKIDWAMGNELSGPHGAAKYAKGCRCQICCAAVDRTDEQRKAEATAAKRNQRARRLDKPRASHAAKGSNVIALPGAQQLPPPASPGLNELAMLAELELIPQAAEHPFIVQQLKDFARAMDNPQLDMGWRDRFSRQCQGLLKDLRSVRKKKSGGRLATVSAMAGRRSRAQ
ncbi:hypothetical protein, partial [Mycobacterium sp. 852002-40037_SCH5390672]|uniref:hypothetical protein n=1 Tax=Mycobacterium sp. 852002-40037_SCH5390672 TaxID=1834089 RepID=UPI000A50B9B5